MTGNERAPVGRFDLLRFANRTRRMEEIFQGRTVTHNPPLLARLRGEIGEDAASNSLEEMLGVAIKEGKHVVVNDLTHGLAIGMRPISTSGIEITRFSRFGNNLTSTNVIVYPRFRVRFIRGPKRVDVAISIFGEKHAAKAQTGETEDPISSSGRYSPAAFVVATEDAILLARVDGKGSLDCSLEYATGAKWVIASPRQPRVPRLRSR